MRTKRRLRGMTLAEVTMATAVMATVLITSMSVFMYASYSWIKTSANVKADADSALAIQIIDRQLRQAMSVTVDTNGNGITYELPMQNADGSYAVPLVWDSITRRIALQGTTLVMTSSNGTTQTLAYNVYPFDPLQYQTTYQIFTTPSPLNFTSVTAMLVTGTKDAARDLVTSRSRQTIYLRNVPPTAN